MPLITVDVPIVSKNLSDGHFSGLAGGQVTPPGNIISYSETSDFYCVEPVTAATAGGYQGVPVNKRIVYINGIGTTRDTHGYTVKLISIITGAKVIGIYNQSGDGKETKILNDLVQCLGDKTGLNNNPATKTLAHSTFKACTRSRYLNIVAHSQGAIITSRAMRQAIGMMLDFYGRRDSVVRPLLEETDKISNRGFWGNVGQAMNPIGQTQDMITRIRLQKALEERILPAIEQKLNTFVSVQTFGGAARFYPNGPRYRHVYNFWDMVPILVGQGDIITGPGRGARVEEIIRNSDTKARDIEDHSINNLYLQSSDNYVDRTGRKVDTTYIPIDMSMLR